MPHRSTTDCAKTIVECIPTGLCLIDRRFRVYTWNQTLARWTGIDSEHIVGDRLTDHFPHLDNPRYRDRIERAFEDRLPVVFSAAIHRRFLPTLSTGLGQSLMYQETLLQPLADQPDRALLVIEDVTASYLQTEDLRHERRSLRTALAELRVQAETLSAARRRANAASRSKSEFLANVSHEIRTPMTAILGFAELLEEEEVSPDQRGRALQTIRENGDHLLQLINDILDISKVEAGRFEVETAECALPELIENLQQTFIVRASNRGIGFQCTVDPQTPDIIVTDPLRLKQVLINLLGNAVKFTDEGHVELRVSWLTDGLGTPVLRFDVTDSGIGMSNDQVDRLFRPFTQVDTSAKRRFSGTGLGLAISQSVVQMLKGDIEVTSAVGEGSCFSVSLPISEFSRRKSLEEPESSTAPDSSANACPNHDSEPKAQVSERPLTGIRVLLADDGLDNQKLISFRLKRDGAEPVIVGNGRAAVDAAFEAEETGNGFHVILMDMQMPVLDGYSATSELRAKGYDRPVIALTAHAMSSDRQTCLDAGCSDYATKPVNWPELRQLILSYSRLEAAVL